MKLQRIALAFCITPCLLGAAPTPKPAAPVPFTDTVCPNATAPVRELDALLADPATLLDAAMTATQRAIAAYKACGDTMQSDASGGGSVTVATLAPTGAEGLHRVQVRQGQYYVLLGRLQRLGEYYNSARDSQQAAIDLVKATIEWQAPSQSTFRSNNVSVGAGSTHTASSVYSTWRETAIEVRDAALAEIKLLPKSAGGAAATK